MKTTRGIARASIALVTILFAMPACISIATYDQFAYQQATSLKVEALALMDKAVDSASHYTGNIQAIITNIEKVYEYEKGRPKNEISTQMWETLKSPDRHLFGGFLKKWQDEKSLSKTYIDDKKETISKAFDIIAELESSKLKPSDAENLFLHL